MRTASIVLLLSTVWPAQAHAYIDPTAGGLMLQVIIGSVFGMIFWFRKTLSSAWRRVMRRKRRPIDG